MSKIDFIKTVADKAQLTQKDMRVIYEAIVETVHEEVKGGERLTLIGFGSFYASQRAARKGISPHSDRTIDIRANKSIRFKSSTALDINKE